MALIVTLFFGFFCKSQDANSAIGVRLAYGGLISYQHKLNNSYRAEGILAIRWGGVEMGALTEKYALAFNTKNVYWFYGGGIHLGIHGRDNSPSPEKEKNKKIYINPGIDFIGGMAIYFDRLPINIAVDYKPSFHFVGKRWFIGEGIALNIRYILN